MLDESGFMLQPLVRRTWAPRGHTPVHYSWDRHDRLSVVSAVTLAPRRHRLGLYFNLHNANITDVDVYRFVMAVRRHARRPLTLVLDRWSVHRKAAKRLMGRHPESIRIEWLPPYAPDLNPAEQVWNRTKYCDLANFLPNDYQHLCRAVHHSLQRTRAMPTILRSFFKIAELNL